MRSFNIEKINISALEKLDVLQVLEEATSSGVSNYICITNSRTAFLANINEDYLKIQNGSLLTLPDGAPLFWYGKVLGVEGIEKISGIEFMNMIFEISNNSGYSHFFFGSTSKSLELLQLNLKNQYPYLDIKGAVSPPFQPIEDFDIDAIAKEINDLSPTFFWCGLGAPKQEILISKLQPKLKSTICVGVGLAFEYIAGTVNRAPSWVQKIGMEWAWRIYQQPFNVKRILKPFSWMLFKLITVFVKRILYGKRIIHVQAAK